MKKSNKTNKNKQTEKKNEKEFKQQGWIRIVNHNGKFSFG